jgi:predicted ArsR family transcriptional regulator
MNTEEQNTESQTPRRRGRPSKQGKSLYELLGTNGEFTVKDIVEKNNIKEYEAHNLVRSAVKNGKAQVVKEVSGGRGKPKKVYRLS